jgi:hypothetical protein
LSKKKRKKRKTEFLEAQSTNQEKKEEAGTAIQVKEGSLGPERSGRCGEARVGLGTTSSYSKRYKKIELIDWTIELINRTIEW